MRAKTWGKSETLLCGFGVLVAILLRFCTSLHPYSGQGKPPMFGDYEAQRHWMEITVNIPIREWYHNTSSNDLQYWGLDYPPLTAYHSYVCGVVARVVNADFIKLGQSRGYESEEHKLFMRYTVLLVDILIFIPAVVLYFVSFTYVHKKCRISPIFAIILSLFYPGLIVIDHGHFQYNCVSLAFAVYAVAFICMNRNVLASVFFCLALNYKQMELYHSIPFFIYLLSVCVPKPGQSAFVGVRKLCKISVSVLVTFAIIWAPFLSDVSSVIQVLHRLFPVARGVFEDKVANVWCALNIFYKFKFNRLNEEMFRYCTITTLVAVLPSSVDLFLRPNIKKFVVALINSSLAFFLFSFQVHEKTILVAAMPVMLYLPVQPITCFWFLTVSIFSMLPLLINDELIVATVSLLMFYIVTFHLIWEYTSGKGRNCDVFVPRYHKLAQLISDIKKSRCYRTLLTNVIKHSNVLFVLARMICLCISIGGFVMLTLLILIFNAPLNYPDLFSLLISVYSCLHFFGFFVYFNVVQFKIPQAAEDIKHFKFKME